MSHRNEIERRIQRVLTIAGTSLIFTALLVPQALAQGETTEPSQRTSERRDASGTETPSRTTETRNADGSRKTQVIESRGMDGTYQTLLEREEQTVQVDSQTTRTVVKEYGRNPDGSRSLLRQTEQETRTLSDGRERTTSNISRPDVNGRMQAVERAVEESRKTGENTREINKRTLAPDVNGNFQEVERVHKVERRSEDGTGEVTSTSSRPDVNGRWGTAEVRKESMAKSDDGSEQTDEQVFRRDINDRESLRERKVTRKFKDASGQEQQVEESYSKANAGSAVVEGDRVPLAERRSTITTTRADGSQRVEQRVERPDGGNPSFGVRVTGQSVGTVSKDANSKQGHHTFSLQGGNGGRNNTVTVDFGEKK